LSNIENNENGLHYEERKQTIMAKKVFRRLGRVL
jgi:hypothetical protein